MLTPIRRPGAPPPSRDAADQAAVRAATCYNVMRFAGVGQYERLGTYDTLLAAQAAKARAGRDAYGRPAMIYAVHPLRGTLFVE